MSLSKVASQASTRENSATNQTNTSRRARNAQRAVTQNTRPVCLIRLVVVRVLVAQDIERSAR